MRSPTPFTCLSSAVWGYVSLAILAIRRPYSWMRSFNDSTSRNSGSKASRNPALNPLVVSRRNCSVPHLRSRSPYDFTNPRAAFTSAVRALTSTARARISVRCSCAWALRCFTGLSSSGSIRASRASVRASRRSSFRRLLVIKRTFWACPTITACPSAVNNRLTQGECVPVSMAMRHRGMLLNTCFMASGVVATLCSKTISPASFKTQYALERSPRSNPMVSCPLKMFFAFVRIVLIFCIAGLLFCAFEHVEHWERIASRGRPAFSSHLVTDHGYPGDYQTVKRFVRRLGGSKRPQAAGIILTEPGEEAQVDYGSGPLVRDPQTGRYRRTRLFVLTLGYSRKSVRLLVWRSRARVWAQLHEKAFRRLGGWPRVVVLDNLKEGVLVPDVYEPAINPLFRDVLAHYSVVALPCRIQDPNRKGKGESGVADANETPLKGMRFESLEEGQAYLDRWEERWADTRIHGTTKRQVAAMFGGENTHL